MTSYEYFLVIILVWMIVGSVWNLGQLPPRETFSPRVFFAFLMAFYVLVGPLIFLARETTTLLDVQVRSIFWKGWLAGVLAHASFLVGYKINWRQDRAIKVVSSEAAAYLLGTCLFGVVGLTMLYWIFVYAGGVGYFFPAYRENAATIAGSESPVATYLMQCVNLTFGAVSLLLLAYLQKRSRLTAWTLGVVLVVSVLFFIKSGFRYRLAWLLADLAATYYLWMGRRPKLSLWVPLGVVVMAAMGFIGMTRNYWAGLDLSKAQGVTGSEFVFAGFSESGTFLILCQAVDQVPKNLPHTNFEPLWIAVTAPIPRAWWPDKPDPRTLRTLADAFGMEGAADSGLAVPFFGEWYIAFGWSGIVVSSLILGIGARRTWEWYCMRDRDALATMIYAVSLGFLHILFSRGLFAMAVLNFAFSIAPLMLLYRLTPKRWFRLIPVDRRTPRSGSRDVAVVHHVYNRD